MQTTLTLLALAASSLVSADGVTSAVYPSPSEKAGCQASLGPADNPTAFAFQQHYLSGNSKRQIDTSQGTDCSAKGDNGQSTLASHLEDGVLTDNHGRTAYVASNAQVQYDDPPQAGAGYTAGWSVCQGGILALGDTTTFYGCLSGTFRNIYNETQGAQCQPFQYVAISCLPGTAPTFTPSKFPIHGAANLDGSNNGNSPSSSSSSSSATPSSTSSSSSSSSTYMTSASASAMPTMMSNSSSAGAAGVAAGSAAPASGTYNSPTASPSPFTGAGAALQVGQGLVALAAAAAAFALL